MDDICKLAEILRENGDKVLNNDSKLTLSADLLNKLNSAFNLITEQRDAVNSSFHVMSGANLKNDLFCDVQFLYDFIQKAPSLKLTPSEAGQLCTEFIDVSQCKSLKLLEMYKISVKLILGMESLKRNLQCLVCIRSINTLKEVLEKCGADECTPSIWNELKEATFSHNSIESIDGSIEYTPWLSSLDLSHNNIENAEMLCCLSNLKYLNLGYNRLSKIPSFMGQICNRLQVLVLCNNFIEDIQEIEKLLNLRELDLTENCLIEHTFLAPLSYLATLQWLHLRGNPLSYHPQHRTRTCCYLHMNTATVKFILDDVVLNKSEQQLIGSLHLKHLRSCRPQTDPLTASITESTVSTDRNRRVRHAKISDDNVPPELDVMESISTLFTIAEPFETKRQIESLHKEYIKSLYSKSASYDPDLQISIHLSSTPYESDISAYMQEVDLRTSERSEATSEPTTYVTASDSLDKIEETSDVYSNKPDNSEQAFEPSDDEELESGESNIFLAVVKGSDDDIIVIITKTHLTEKDPITMKGLGRFALDTLTVCDTVVESDISYVYIEFDTVRTDRSRYYHISAEEEAERFYKRLRSIIDNRPPNKDMFTTYRCMKCSTQFAVEKQKTMHQQAVKCPSCESDLVVEDDS